MTLSIKRLLSLSFLAVLVTATLALGSPPSRAAAAAAATAMVSDSDAARESMDWIISGPMGGDVRSLVIDPQDPQRLYFGTLDGQIYLSTNGGQEWSRLTGFNRPGLYIDNLIVDPRNSLTIYAAAHRHKEPGGFFKTTDGGTIWREAPEMKNEAIHSLTQAPSNPDILLVGTNNGVYRSGDGGETWSKLPTTGMTNINVESLAVDPRSENVIYAGTWHLPFKSTDGGQSWNATKTGIIDDSDVFAIEIDSRNPDHVIASACSGIYETNNAGATWRKVNGIPSQSRRTRAILQHPLKPEVIFAGTTEGFWLSTNGGNDWRVTTSRQSFEINAIAVHPKNPETVFIGTNNYGVMISRDGGKSFAPSNDGYSGRRAYSILPDREEPGRIYAATINTATGGGYFYVSNDSGRTWQVSNRSMPNRLIAYSILQDRVDGNVIYLGTNYGMYRSLDRGASWAPVTAPKPTTSVPSKKGRRGVRATLASPRSEATAATAPTSPRQAKGFDEGVKRVQESLALAGYDVGVPDGRKGQRTIAAVKQFQIDRGLPQTGELDDATLAALPVLLTDTVNALAHLYDDRSKQTGMLAATNAGLYRTNDISKGWERISFDDNLNARALCISTSERNPSVIYVGTATSGVLVSRDRGATWQQVAGIKTDAPINVIEQDPQRSTHVYVGSTQTFYVSHDGGERWLRRGGNLPLGSFTSIVINAQNPDEIFVGNAYEFGGSGRDFSAREGGGVFRSIDAGQTWQRLDPALPSRRVWALALDARDPNRIFVGSHSAGVYVAQRTARAAAQPNEGGGGGAPSNQK